MRPKFLALVVALSSWPLIAAQPAVASNYSIDAGHSSVLFKVSYANVSPFWGRFNKVQGKFVYDQQDLARANLSVEIDADSVFTADRKRDDHLKSPDFFNVKQFPKITFQSTGVKAGSRDGTYIVSGNLTLRGVTKPVTVELTKTGEGKDARGQERIGFEGSFTINRLDFGVSFMPEGLGKEVTVLVAVAGVKS